MTKAGEKWAEKQNSPHSSVLWTGNENTYEQAEFWIRVFCDAVEVRADFQNKLYDEAIGKAFYDLRHELLG